MKTISMLSVVTGIPMKKLRSLEKYGLEFEENDFEIDYRHQKAINDIRSKRLSPYVLTYTVQCKIENSWDSDRRLDDIDDIAGSLGFSLDEELSEIEWYNVEGEKLLGAKLWIDRAAAREIDNEALT